MISLLLNAFPKANHKDTLSIADILFLPVLLRGTQLSNIIHLKVW